MQDLPFLNVSEFTDFTLAEFFVQLLIGVLLSTLLQKHFSRYSRSVSNRQEMRVVLPFLALTTLLVIAVVKSSLALSLGLVGALSIVRFRTPVKEPEELAYIFVAIAIGLGLGANQTGATVVGLGVILVVVAVMRRHVGRGPSERLLISVGFRSEPPSLEELGRVLLRHSKDVDLQRYGTTGDLHEFLYSVAVDEVGELDQIVREIRLDYEVSSLSVVDPPRVPGL